jgi:membrane-associated phospholipid phosphatase
VSGLIAGRLLPQRASRWRSGFGFDEAVRDALRLRSPSARRWARDASDIALTISQSWPFFDALVAAGWYRDSPTVGVQQALISAEVLAVTAGMQGLVSFLAARERPYGRDCAGGVLPDGRDCQARDRYYSFYSGHSSQSFAAAAVNCMHHAYVPLYGGGAADDWACVAGLGVATTTALLRVVTDVHYVSDVVVGAAMGTATGLVLPWALHYRFGPKQVAHEPARAAPGLHLTLLPLVTPNVNGVQGVGTF